MKADFVSRFDQQDTIAKHILLHSSFFEVCLYDLMQKWNITRRNEIMLSSRFGILRLFYSFGFVCFFY